MKRFFLAALFCVSGFHATAQEQCESVADCAQKAMEAALQAKIVLQVAVPKGAVMAFNLDTCPDGWQPFTPLNGRVAMGAGTGSGLSERTFGQTGGAETHTLTTAQMPGHSHTYSSTNNGQLLDNGGNFPAVPRYGTIGNKTTTATGGGGAHNIMQPFLVLNYCERQ